MTCEQRPVGWRRRRRPRPGKQGGEEEEVDELADAGEGEEEEVEKDEEGEEAEVVMLAYCAKHTPSHAAEAETLEGTACKVCGDRGDAERMLLCEDCDDPYHTVRGAGGGCVAHTGVCG